MRYGELNLGQIEAIVNKLGGMEGVQRFLSGTSEVVIKDHVINCDANPFIPDGWKVEEHQKGGQFKWDAKQVELWLSDGQKKGRVEGNKLRKEMAKKTPFNANVLDYLLAHPELIPDEWKGKYVFFWGTIYRDSSGDLYVRCLCWRGSRWDWSGGWVGGGWRGRGPAALRAS